MTILSLFGAEDSIPMPRSTAKPEKPVASSAAVLAVFEAWRERHPRSMRRPHNGMKEWRLIAARLSEGYTVKDLIDAIAGMHHSPYHCGFNDQQTRYLSLELCVRDAKHVDMFIEKLEEEQAVEEKQAERDVARQREEAESIAIRIVKDGRKRKLTEESIRMELSQAGAEFGIELYWPGEEPWNKRSSTA